METLEQALEEDRRVTRFLKFKLWFDALAQIIILGIFFFNFGFGQSGTAFCTFYFVLGGYQLLSSILHLTFEKAFAHRRNYYIQLLIHGGAWALIAIGFTFNAPPLMFPLFIELLLAPATAIYYFVITIQDLQALPRHI
ncbi:MAG TPA: hypothetical protein VK177_02890 [Flavobacteriales bacterium]|nr:hypothetical protein [Flavobacteriales bacterium]